MIDYKVIEAEVLDDVRPLIIEKYLLFQDIMHVPKEVIRTIDDIICLYKDINRIKIINIFVIKLIYVI